MTNNKKAQITAFIIIGVILLFAAALILFIKTQLNKDVEQPDLPDAPTKIEPVVELVGLCLEQVSKEALEKIGLHGGYTDPESYGLNIDPYQPTESDALSVAAESGFDVAYWHFMKSDNECTDCVFSSWKPHLESPQGASRDASIESQISKYVNDHIQDCLNSFREMEPEFSVAPEGEPKASTSITRNEVVVNLQYPLSISAQGEQFSHSQYRATHDLNFRKIYEAAQEIVQTQQKSGYFEKQTLDWIQAASMPAPSNDRMPPIFAQDNVCGMGTFWVKTDVEENKLKPLLQSYTPSTQFFGSANYAPPQNQDEMAEAFYSMSILPMNATFMQGLNARAMYMGWPLYFDISPRAGEILGNVDISMNLLFFSWCQHLYEYSYQISYPLLIELNDPAAFKGEGYTFYFAIEPNIRNNKPANIGPVDFSGTIAVQDSSFGAPEQRLSGELTMKAVDGLSDEQMEDVLITFCIPDAQLKCVESVNLGSTKSASPPKLVEKLPLGYGLLIATKEGYHPAKVSHLSRLGAEGEVGFELQPYVDVPVTINKHLVGKVWEGISYSWDLTGYTESVSPSEQALVTVERVTEGVEEAHSQFISIDYEEPSDTIRLIPGKYRVEVTIMDYNDIVVPQDRICKRACPVVCKKECADIPRVELDSAPVGGVLFDDTTGGYFEVTKEDLKSGKALEIQVATVVPEHIYKHEDLKQLGQHEAYSRSYRNQLEPQWYELSSS